MRILFVKEKLAWPRSSGHDVHGYNMMQALAELGHQVALATRDQTETSAVDGLDLAEQFTYSDSAAEDSPILTGWQERFRSYWGIENQAIHSVAQLAKSWQADVVVAVGLEVLPLLGAVQ